MNARFFALNLAALLTLPLSAADGAAARQPGVPETPADMITTGDGDFENELDAIVGRTLQVNGHPLTVIGVAREGFHGTTMLSTDVWSKTPCATCWRRAIGETTRQGTRKPRRFVVGLTSETRFGTTWSKKPPHSS